VRPDPSSWRFYLPRGGDLLGGVDSPGRSVPRFGGGPSGGNGLIQGGNSDPALRSLIERRYAAL